MMDSVVDKDIGSHRIYKRPEWKRKLGRESAARWRRNHPEKAKEWRKNHPGYTAIYCHRLGITQSMSKNRKCASFLGVHVAERVLAASFEEVKRMPIGNPGFDFICKYGFKIDVKSSCRRRKPQNGGGNWAFSIRRNRAADYFLCLAFNNREDLRPEHVWLLPASLINNKSTFAISESNLCKWAQFEKPIDKIIAVCNIVRGGCINAAPPCKRGGQ
jgi:hypothetical protein